MGIAMPSPGITPAVSTRSPWASVSESDGVRDYLFLRQTQVSESDGVRDYLFLRQT